MTGMNHRVFIDQRPKPGRRRGQHSVPWSARLPAVAWPAFCVLLVAAVSSLVAQESSEPRMWLELEPARFGAQPMVVRILYLQELAPQFPLEGQPADAPRRGLFEQAEEGWQRRTISRSARPALFEPSELRELADLGGPGRLYWRAAGEPRSLLEMIGDLEQIWGGGIQHAVADYATAFDMLGRFHAGVAEIRESQGRLTGRLVLLASSASEAKRARSALQLASTVGRMVAAGAVRTGQMTEAEAGALDAVLASIDTRVDGARLTIHLGIDTAVLAAILPADG